MIASQQPRQLFTLCTERTRNATNREKRKHILGDVVWRVIKGRIYGLKSLDADLDQFGILFLRSSQLSSWTWHGGHEVEIEVKDNDRNITGPK